MLRMVAWGALALGVLACTELPSAPGGGGDGGSAGSPGVGGNVGTGGIGGSAGAGGAGGMGAAAGAGGAGGAGGVDLCAVFPKEADNVEPDDDVESGVVMGFVSGACAMGSCTGDDPVDRWSITTCGGKHSIDLAWSDINRDLDLYLSDADDTQIGQSATPDTTSETILTDLQGGELYVVEVQAFDTNGATQSYTLGVSHLE